MDFSPNGILIVDDEPAVLQVVREFLTQAGHDSLFFAPSALAARKIWSEQSSNIHLVITDLILPDGRGTQLARDFLNANLSCRAILMTGYTPEFVDLGGDLNDRAVLLHKPFTGEELLRIVNVCLAARNAAN